MKQNVIYLHGFASSAKNSKAEWLRQKNEKDNWVNFFPFDFNPTPVDFSAMTVTGMINRLRQFIMSEKLSDPILVGSSLGGLVALHYAKLYPGVKGLLLLAPALRFYVDHYDSVSVDDNGSVPIFHYAFNQELPLFGHYFTDGLFYQNTVFPPMKMTILHGIMDEVVPFADSQAYVDKYPSLVDLIDLNSDHRMSDQVDVIWEWIKKLAVENP